ncbi:MAG: homoserine kinase [Rhodospirillaceae bacterium]|nr:homoserine kinase [Rhodospirillaceae bacterium]MCA8934499.1 homoserine kinase [Rhodospirillaceae bacterium]
MAVYTEVTDEEVSAFVAEYDIGAVVACKGIAEGVENSNYLLVTTGGRFILTLYEKRVAEADLPFFVALMQHLASNGIRCPLPLSGRDGQTLRRLSGRPAAIVTFLDGMWPRRIQPVHCHELGRGLAAMHLAGADFSMVRVNDLSVAGWRPLFEACGEGADSVSPGLGAALAAELDILEAAWPADLPAGVIHADLFPDNVFFRNSELSGFIDFYFACTDLLAYDIAVCLNAWCFEVDGAFNITKARALLSAYTAERPVSAEELAALPVLARGAAIRFLLTRLYDWLNVPDGALVRPKDPLEYWKKLRFHQQVSTVAAYGLDP